MTPIATMTVIRGKGDVQGIINGVVSQEAKRIMSQDAAALKALRKKYEDGMEYMNMLKNDRNNSREAKIKLLNAKKHKTFKDKAIDKIAFVLACFIAWGESIMPYLIEYVGDEEEWK